MSLAGEDKDNTIIDQFPVARFGGQAIIVAASDITVSGFTLTNFGLAIQIAYWKDVEKTHSYISNDKVVGNRIINSNYSIWVETGNDFAIKNNEIFNSSLSGIMLYPQAHNGIISGNTSLTERSLEFPQ